jgi:glycosyltransferase involved in cell wall biosynthesis
MKKAVFLSSYDARDPLEWSGVPFNFSRALRSQLEQLIILAPLSPPFLRDTQLKAHHYRQRGLWYLPERDSVLLRRRAERANVLLQEHSDAEVIFVTHPPDAAFLKTTIPIAIIHDSTWRQYTSTYPDLLNMPLAEETYESGCLLERVAYENARWLFPFTCWAAQAIGAEYPHINALVCPVLPGAGTDTPALQRAITTHVRDRSDPKPTLLFVGRDGRRKGVDIALDVHLCLQSRGVHSRLALVGVDDLSMLQANNATDVVTYPFLNRGSPADAIVLSELFSQSFALVVPSRADCSSLAICDAAAYALPSIAADVGGNAELVGPRNSGVVLPRNASPELYANVIQTWLLDSDMYLRACLAARSRYQSILNWKTYAGSVIEIIDRGR